MFMADHGKTYGTDWQYPTCPSNSPYRFCVVAQSRDTKTSDPRDGRIRSIEIYVGTPGTSNSGCGKSVMPVMTAQYGELTKITPVIKDAGLVSGHILNSKFGKHAACVDQNPQNFFVQSAASNTNSAWADAEDVLKLTGAACKDKTGCDAKVMRCCSLETPS